jgi:hypothetical protein
MCVRGRSHPRAALRGGPHVTGSKNVALGDSMMPALTSGIGNVALDFEALHANTTGSVNIAIGQEALFLLSSGSNNVALGGPSGEFLKEGSDNVDNSSFGAAKDEHTIRIGAEGDHMRTFLAGVQNSNVSGCSVQVTSEGRLGCNNNQAGSAVATYKRTKKVLTGKCLNFTGANGPGTGACPAVTSGYSASKLLSSPMPANGATVSNLAANTSATVSGGDTAVVEVIDNTTTTTLLTCTVNSTNKNNCTNSASTGSAAARDKLEVRITATGASGNEKFWEVTFRY